MKTIKINSKITLQVSREGEIYFNGKLKTPYKLKSKEHSKGFLCVSVNNTQLYVHKLVAQAYVPNPKPVSFKNVFHIDFDTLNNNPDNLVWSNFKEIVPIRKEKGYDRNLLRNTLEYRGSSKISYEEAKKIALRLDDGVTACKIAKEYSVSEMSIIRIRKRYCKNKQASPRYSKETKEICLGLLLDHKPKVVAETTGVPYETILRWHKKSLYEKIT